MHRLEANKTITSPAFRNVYKSYTLWFFFFLLKTRNNDSCTRITTNKTICQNPLLVYNEYKSNNIGFLQNKKEKKNKPTNIYIYIYMVQSGRACATSVITAFSLSCADSPPRVFNYVFFFLSALALARRLHNSAVVHDFVTFARRAR